MCNRYNIKGTTSEFVEHFNAMLPMLFDVQTDDILPGHLAPGLILNRDGERELVPDAIRPSEDWGGRNPSTGNGRTTTPESKSTTVGRGSCHSKSIAAFCRCLSFASRAIGAIPPERRFTSRPLMASISAWPVSTTCGKARAPRNSIR